MKKDMPLEGLRWSRDSGSALYDTPQTAVLGRAGGQRKILTYSRILRMINQGNCRLFLMNAGTLSSRAWMPGVRIRATRTVT